MRVVSVTCSNTEIVCALGEGHLLVGVDDHSDHPQEVVSRLPRVGPDLGIDVDRVRALRPDLVLASLSVPGHDRVVDALVAAGLRVEVLDPTHLDDVPHDVERVARLLGVPERGRVLADQLRVAFTPRPPPPVRPRILVEWWPKPVIVPGRDSWVTQLIERAGGIQPLADDPCRSRALAEGEVARLAPDAVVISWCGVPAHRYRVDVVARRPDWQATPALRNHHIVPITEAKLGRPGPRLAEGLEALRAVVDAVVEGPG